MSVFWDLIESISAVWRPNFVKTLVVAQLVIFGVFLAVPKANAQATGAISGTVTDTSGAAIADAQLQAKNTGTGFAQTTTSDAQGRYRFPDLGIGDYEIQAVKMGFSIELRRGVTLTVGGQPVVDLQMQVGQQNQTVTVEGQVSQVETQSTAVGALVESKQISELPLNGRNFTQLLTLAPGVTQIPILAPGGGSTFYGNGQKYTIAGSRPSGQGYLLDDQDMVNFWNNGPGAGGLGTALGVEAIAEFQTLINTYSAQFGGNGAVINASSKSGTNSFHGSGFEFLRNNDLEARNFFDAASPPTFRRNQFGGSVGGPIKKDKIFFFTTYEGLRSTQIITNEVVVPDQCAHQFLTTISFGNCGPAVAQAGTPYATNAAVRQATQATMALYPNSAFNELGGNSGTGDAFVADPNIGKENYFLARVDYTLSDKDSLFVRYVLDKATRNFTTGIPYWPELDTTSDNFANIEERRIISSKIVNLAHVGFSRTWEDANVFGSPTVAGVTGNALSGPGVLAGVAVNNGTIASSGYHPLQFFGTAAGREDGNTGSFSGTTALGASTTLPFYLVPNKFQFGDDVIWTSGAHSIKFGGNAVRERENTWAPFVVGGSWTFASLTTFLQGTAAQVQGQATDAQDPTADATKDYRYWVFSPYIDDQWKLSSKLTVNLGLRYSPTTSIGEVRHLMYDIPNPQSGTFVPVTTETASNPSLKNWDPRVGIALDPFNDHKTSIRASFGEFHNVVYSRDLNHWLQPPFLTLTQTSAQGLLYPSPFTNTPPASSPTAVPIPTNGSLSVTNGNYYQVHSTPYQMQWNLTIQREVMANTVFTIGYVGSHNLHMFAQEDFNYPVPCVASASQVPAGTIYSLTSQTGCFYNGAPTYIKSLAGTVNNRINPLYNSLQFADNLASSHYEALQTSLNRRFSNHWQTQVTYTLSKSIDNGSGTYGLDGGGLSSQPNNVNADYGLSNFNRKNNFRVSAIYSVPFRQKGFVGQAINGWQLTGVYTYLSGAPLNTTSATNRVFTGTGQNAGRPNIIAGCNLYSDQSLAAGQWFNPACFTLQAQGTFGDVGRDVVIGPNLWNLDDSLTKDWAVNKISEQFRIQFRAEAFNILNHPSFQLIAANGTIFAGTAINGSAGKLQNTSSSPRQLQLALKIVF